MKSLEQRITEIKFVLSDQNVFFDCVSQYREALNNSLDLIQELQEENIKLKQQLEVKND
jgi:hypothetical protein